MTSDLSPPQEPAVVHHHIHAYSDGGVRPHQPGLLHHHLSWRDGRVRGRCRGECHVSVIGLPQLQLAVELHLWPVVFAFWVALIHFVLLGRVLASTILVWWPGWFLSLWDCPALELSTDPCSPQLGVCLHNKMYCWLHFAAEIQCFFFSNDWKLAKGMLVWWMFKTALSIIFLWTWN